MSYSSLPLNNTMDEGVGEERRCHRQPAIKIVRTRGRSGNFNFWTCSPFFEQPWTMAEVITPIRLAIPASESHTPDPDYPQNSIPLRFLET